MATPATVASTNVTVAATKTSDWGSGYDGAFVVTNRNDYDILAWTLDYDMAEAFTWFSDGALTKTPAGRTRLTPKDWLQTIKARSQVTIGFGGRTELPRNVAFNQVLPLVGDDPAEAKRGAWGPKVVAPYCDACAWPVPDLPACAKESGLRYFTLAFVTADAHAQPAWGGVIALSTQHMLAPVRAVRAMGGDVSVSFGGANGTELAQAVKRVPDLVAAYSKVIDTYSLRRVDFDIEGGAVADAASVDRRNKAIAALNAKYPGLEVTYCLPVLPTGLTADGVALVKNAAKNGAKIHAFHAMSMDFGDSAAPPKAKTMGAYVVDSAHAVRAQVAAAGYPGATVGLIPMIGVNDVQSEVFTLKDAAAVRAFFRATPWMSYVGWWSINRDRPGPGHGANSADSGVAQKPWAFAKAFLTGA